MKPGDWYKNFGGRGKTAYYRIVSIENDEVYVEFFVYHPVLQRILAVEQCSFSAKDWMEQEMCNDVHQLPKAQVPFLIPV
jgi:hypothetical protein